MKKRIKKKIKKLKKSINKINKVRVQKGRKAMLQETWATVTYGLYDNRKIRRLKKFPPALVENRMLFETNDDFTDNGRALFDYLIEKGYNKKYEIVWLVHEPSKYKEYQFENVKFVQNFKKGSTIRRAEAYKYALTSKYIFTPRLLTGLVCREEISSLSISGMAVVTRQIRTGVRFSLIIVWYRGTFLLRPKWNFLDVLPKNCSRLDIPVMI